MDLLKKVLKVCRMLPPTVYWRPGRTLHLNRIRSRPPCVGARVVLFILNRIRPRSPLGDARVVLFIATLFWRPARTIPLLGGFLASLVARKKTRAAAEAAAASEKKDA